MNFTLLYKPLQLIERLAVAIKRRKRLKKLQHTPAANLSLGHIDSLELLEIIKNENSITPDTVILDVGSNTGTWTLLAKALFPESHLYAFEPLPSHINAFKNNVKLLPNIYLHPYCLGNENTSAVLNVSSFSDSSSLLNATPLEFEHFNIKKQAEERVEVKRLADLITNQEIPVPQIIKLDVQGFELEVLKGLDEYLRQVKYIICEVSFKAYYHGQPMFLDIANYLAGFGFNLFALGNNTPIGTELNQIDVLFKQQ